MMLHEESVSISTTLLRSSSPSSGTWSSPARLAHRRAPPRGRSPSAIFFLHTSGLNPRTSEIYRREQVRSRTMTMAQFIANLVRVPLMEDPGTRYRYSEGTSVLGRLVEIWSGKPFEVFLDERIFRPLRMTDTMFWAATPEQRARLDDGVRAGAGRRPHTGRDRDIAVHRAPDAHRGRCRPAVHRARLRALQSNAPQQGRSWTASVCFARALWR